MDADPATLTEPERRVALLDWLARGRDIRIAAELCGEKHDWAKDIAKAAGHPDRDQIRQALAAAKAELHPPRQPLKPDSIAPVRPRIPAPSAEEIEAFAAIAREKAPTLDDAVDAIAEALSAAPPFVTRPMAQALAEHVAVTVCGADAIDETGGAAEDDDEEVVEPLPCPDCRSTERPCDCLAAVDDEFDDVLAADVDHAIETGEPLLEDPTRCEHQARLVLEGRLWHAVRPACGTTWHRTRCTAPGCGAYVSAEYIARTGSTRHDWHPKEQS